MKNPKNTITNIAAVLIVAATAVKETLAAANGDAINWLAVAMAVAVAVIGWFTGKPNAK